MSNIFTDNKDFYPTPVEVIEKMLMDECIFGKTILEPSAGKGDISEYLMQQGAKVLVCENDRNNIKLLEGKYDEFLAEDFFTVTAEQVSHVNMIVMNPPFSNAEKHILHAYEIAPAGCTIIALCNSNTLNNGYSTTRMQLKEIIENYGRHEYLGNVFKSSERDTDVYVELIKLYKEGTGESEFDGYVFDMTDTDDLNANTQNGLVGYNVIRDLVNRYTQAVKQFDLVMKASEEINSLARIELLDVNGKPKTYQPILPIKFGAYKTNVDERQYGAITHDYYKKELKKYYWKIVFDLMGMERYSTTELRKQMNRFIETQTCVPFTMSNISKLIDVVIQTHGQRLQKALEDAFDKICSLSAHNSTAGEKWKTNANYMVNKKFIVNYIGEEDWRGRLRVRRFGHNIDALNDLVKALCFLTGTAYENIPDLCDIVEDKDFGKWFDWGFFRVKLFKKGTGHFEFLDEKVWAQFNQTVAKARGWQVGT